MKRLTKDNYTDDLFEKQKDLIQIDKYISIHYSQANYNEDLWKKVKQIEDLEEELGCPLEVVFKALKQDYIYTKYGRRSGLELGTYGCSWCICCGLRLQIEAASYKKTWWLKEDKRM